MRIIQTPPRFYPYIGGVENYVYYLSNELIKRGHLVNIICANEPPGVSEKVDGMEVERLRYIGKVANTNITLGLPKLLLKKDFDIIHTHLPTPWSADFSGIITALKRKPLFLTYHNDITGRGVNKFIAGSYNLTLLKFLLNKAYRIFLTSENYLKYSSYLKRFLDKCIIASPGVDLEKFKPLNLAKNNGNNIVFFLAKLDRFHIYKGLENLLLSVKKIINKVPLKLYIGGAGDLLDYYKARVRKYGLENAVVFLGVLSREDAVKYYNLCDVFVLPSTSSSQEGFGLVALEAMACEKPVIITDIIGVALDVKRKHAGIVVNPKKIEELAEAMEYLFLNPEDIRIMGENALRLVKENYTWHKHTDIIEKEYLRVLN